MKEKYVPPEFQKSAYHCPRCGVVAEQNWWRAGTEGGMYFNELRFVRCSHCTEWQFWAGNKLVWPAASLAPPPNADLPADVKADYVEAASIVSQSPRGAAALLRLCVQKLCKALGCTSGSINDDIAQLVAKGLPQRIQQALDVVRVVGNDAVHAGELDPQDDPATAAALFGLVNLIAEDRITREREIATLYGKLPEGKRKAIEKRDAPKK
jgi:hypothetical protein